MERLSVRDPMTTFSQPSRTSESDYSYTWAYQGHLPEQLLFNGLILILFSYCVLFK